MPTVGTNNYLKSVRNVVKYMTKGVRNGVKYMTKGVRNGVKYMMKGVRNGYKQHNQWYQRSKHLCEKRQQCCGNRTPGYERRKNGMKWHEEHGPENVSTGMKGTNTAMKNVNNGMKVVNPRRKAGDTAVGLHNYVRFRSRINSIIRSVLPLGEGCLLFHDRF